MKTYAELKGELLKDPATKREYDKLEVQFSIASQLIAARIERGLTQEQLAKKMGTKQAAVARMESVDYNPTVKSLEKVAQALGTTFTIKIG